MFHVAHSVKVIIVHQFHVTREVSELLTGFAMLLSVTRSHIRNGQQYALICNTPLVYVLAATYFGSNLPSSGSFLGVSELLEIQIEWVVYHIMCGYVACVPDCRGSVCCASQLHVHTMHIVHVHIMHMLIRHGMNLKL
jgi:hypothetical protein